MNKQELLEALSATEILDTGHEPESGFDKVCACDMMSELLAVMNQTHHDCQGVVLLTGLTNPQVIRTSEMVDIRLVVFLRGKKPAPDTVELAKKCGISILSTPHTMFKGCGILYGLNLKDIQAEKRYV